MAKVISLFNHKGGVSKTTTTFNLGWMLAKKGKKVLVIDADPQCNLTGLFVGMDNCEQFYENGLAKSNNIYKLFEPTIIKGKSMEALPTLDFFCHPRNKNLFLLPGEPEVVEVESRLSVGIKVSEAIGGTGNYPGIIAQSIEKIAKQNQFDIVLLDLSPSIGSLNMCLLMSSNYFLVPTSPDFYCYQAIISLSNRIPQWDGEIDKFRGDKIDVPFPKNKPRFLGIVSQRYRPYKTGDSEKDASTAFQRWIDKINKCVCDKLVNALEARGMSISEELFTNSFKEERPYNMVNISEFNALIARSQEYSIPVYELNESHLLSFGKALSTQLENVKKFEEIFNKLSTGLLLAIS